MTTFCIAFYEFYLSTGIPIKQLHDIIRLLCKVYVDCVTRGWILGRSWDKSLKRFPPLYSLHSQPVVGKSRPSIKTPWGVSFSRPVAYPNTLSFGGAIDPGTLGCPEFWRCYRPRHTNLLTVTTPNTQLLPLPRKMSLSSSTSFFWGYKVFFIWGIQCGNVTVSDHGNEGKSSRLQRGRLSPPPTKLSLYL